MQSWAGLTPSRNAETGADVGTVVGARNQDYLRRLLFTQVVQGRDSSIEHTGIAVLPPRMFDQKDLAGREVPCASLDTGQIIPDERDLPPVVRQRGNRCVQKLERGCGNLAVFDLGADQDIRHVRSTAPPVA